MSTLYPAKVNSPVTELSAAIDSAATTITVLNGNALPDAPNIATIGQGDTAETVKYGGKTGNTLSDVVRGFEGAARSWTAGTKIARNFTAYDYDTIRTKLDEGQTIPAPIVRGTNVINATQASGATFKVLGCSLCNILGRDGGCESLTPFLTSGSGTDALSSVDGIKSIKFTTNNDAKIRYKDYSYTLDQSKYYLVGCWVYVDSYTSGSTYLALRDITTNTNRYTAPINTSLVGQRQFVYAKIPLSNTLVGGFRLYFGVISSGTMAVQFGSIRLYEVTAAEYAAIGTTITGEAIDRRWPYVDGVQHLQGVSVRKLGKNQYDGNVNGIGNGALTFLKTDPTTWEITSAASTSNYIRTAQISVSPNTTYTLSATVQNVSGADLPLIRVRKGSDWSGLAEVRGNGRIRVTFNTGSESSVYMYLYGSESTVAIQTKRYSDIQLELGNIDSAFERYNPQYAHVPIKLASNVDRTIADIYDSSTGEVFRQYVTDVKLDGSLPWTLINNYSGFKRIGLSALEVSYRINTAPNGVKYDGTILGVGNTASFADRYGFQAVTPYFLLSVSNADSGWTDAVSPNNNAVKALTNGWKANGNNGTVYNSWVSILTGAAPATNTEAYVAANKAPGWNAYATLEYVRATPIVETLTGDLGGLSMVKGGNAVELLEGVIVREKVKAVQYAFDGRWFINRDFSGLTESKLDKATNDILHVYKGGVKDHNWITAGQPSTTFGSRYAHIAGADYDPTAEYFVDYIVMDKYLYTTNAVDATLVYQSTLGGAVAQNTVDIAGLKKHNGVQDWQLMLDEAYAANLRMDLDGHTGNTSNPHGVTKSQVGLGNAPNYPAATQAQAEAGTDNATLMTPLRTKQLADDMARTLSMGGMI